MTSGELCRSCQGWRREDDELFCGLCGASFLQLEAKVKTAFTYEDEGHGDGIRDDRPTPAPRELRVELTNKSGLRARGTRIRLELDSTRFTDEREITDSSDDGIRIDNFELPLSDLRYGRPHLGRILQVTPHDRPDRLLTEVGFGLPRPRLVLQPKEIVLDEAQIERGKARFDIVMKEGVLAPIKSIRIEEVDDISGPAREVATNRRLPTILRRGDVLHAEVRFSPRAFGSLLRTSGSIVERTLIIELVDLQSWNSYKLRFRSDTPPRPAFRMPGRIHAMLDRPLRLPIVLHNSGSRSCTLAETQLMKTSNGGDGRILELRHGADRPLEGGRDLKFTVTLEPDSDFGRILKSEGERRFRVVQGFREEDVETIACDILLTVREPRPLSSILSIDFGTSESAVSLFDNLSGRAPKLIEIGEEGAFVPTVIAYYLDRKHGKLACEIGHAAQRLVERENGEDCRFFDNLKWRISEHDLHRLPDGSQVDMVRIVSDYLSRLKERIETHPEVAAEVTKAYITRPARFGNTKSNYLEEAFRHAGIKPQLVPPKTGRPVILSESLSPSMLVAHMPYLAEIKEQALRGEVLQDPLGKTHWLLTIDIGGGSADFSLFQIDYVDFANLTINEVAFDGDHRVCGNRISAWLYDAIRGSLRDNVSNRNINPDDVPVHFPWESIPTSGVDSVQRRNGLAIAELLFELQREVGPFADLVLSLGQSFGAASRDKDAAEALAVESDLSNLETFQDLIFDPDSTSNSAARLQAEWNRLPFAPNSLLLTTRDGQTLEIPWAREGGLSLNLREAMPAFMKDLYRPLESHLRRLVDIYRRDMDAEPEEAPLNVLVTGRGGLFPLADLMILHQLAKIAGRGHVRPRRVEVALSKSITSLGACLIAGITSRAAGVRFHAHAASWIAVIGEPSGTISDRVQVHRLFEGELLPEDGLCFAERAMPPGLRVIELVQVTEEETDIPHDRELVTKQIQFEMEPPETAAMKTYIVVRAKEPNALEIGIGFCHADKEPTRQEESFDRISWLETRSMLPFDPA